MLMYKIKRLIIEIMERINRLMKIDILTLFPDMFTSLNHSILGKARDKNNT